jgi:hypothetical protein
MRWRRWLLAELGTGGLRVVTRLADGTVGAVFVIQPDGDIISQVSRSFLADPGAQARHRSAIEGTLAALRRATWLAHVAVVSLGSGAGYLALQEHPVLALSGAFGLAAQLAIGRLRQRGRRVRRRRGDRAEPGASG